MDEDKPRRRQTQFTRLARTKRILERLRQGWAYDEVAAEEQLTERRVRQIVTEFLKEREAVSDSAHAQIQIDRLGRAMRVAGDALARGDIRAISPLIRVMDRLDRYQKLTETAPRPKTVDQRAADRIIMDSLIARVKHRALEEGLRREAPEGDAAGDRVGPGAGRQFSRRRALRRRRSSRRAAGAAAAVRRAASERRPRLLFPLRSPVSH
jgi:hypothetical protein